MSDEKDPTPIVPVPAAAKRPSSQQANLQKRGNVVQANQVPVMGSHRPDAQQGDGITRFYRVKEDREIPRGGGTFKLTRGDTISSQGYDIQDLEAKGALLEPCDPPAWWVAANRRASEAAVGK